MIGELIRESLLSPLSDNQTMSTTEEKDKEKKKKKTKKTKKTNNTKMTANTTMKKKTESGGSSDAETERAVSGTVAVTAATAESYSRAEFVMAHLCMQPDFNGNTVIHLAAQSGSLDVLRQINPVCVRNSLYIYNDEGLNTFLIACRYGSLKFMRYFVEHSCLNDPTVVAKLMRDSRDQANIKNCLHYACGRGCGKSCLQVVGYLTRVAASLFTDTSSVRFRFLSSILFFFVAVIVFDKFEIKTKKIRSKQT